MTPRLPALLSFQLNSLIVGKPLMRTYSGSKILLMLNLHQFRLPDLSQTFEGPGARGTDEVTAQGVFDQVRTANGD